VIFVGKFYGECVRAVHFWGTEVHLEFKEWISSKRRHLIITKRSYSCTDAICERDFYRF